MKNQNYCNGCYKNFKPCNLIDLYTDPFTMDNRGEYSIYVCEDCNNKLQGFLPIANRIYDTAQTKIEKLESEWKYQCKKDNE